MSGTSPGLLARLAEAGLVLAEASFAELGAPADAGRPPPLLRRGLEIDAGDLALRRALAALPGCEAARPVREEGRPPRAVGASHPIALSLTHGRRRAFAVAGPVAGVGVDLCDFEEAGRLSRLAPRFLSREAHLAGSPRELCSVWAAKEAGLKALGLGLFDGGALSRGGGRVLVLSLSPPGLDPAELRLALGECPDGALAVAWRP